MTPPLDLADYTTITDRTPELLSTMDSLERITFDTCHGLTNTGGARLARLPKLRELRVSGQRISRRSATRSRQGWRCMRESEEL